MLVFNIKNNSKTYIPTFGRLSRPSSFCQAPEARLFAILILLNDFFECRSKIPYRLEAHWRSYERLIIFEFLYTLNFDFL